MSLRDLIATDWRVWDNRESVTLALSGTDSPATHAVDDAKRRAITFKELAPSGGAYTGKDVVWLIPVEKLPEGVTPRMADRVIDSESVAWTILDAAYNTWRTWWRLTTRNIVLAANLRDLVDVYRPTFAEVNGVPVPTYPGTPTYAAVNASVQEQAGQVEEAFGRKQVTKTYSIFVETRLNLRPDDRIVANGVTYQLRGWRSADQLGLLQEIDAEVLQ